MSSSEVALYDAACRAMAEAKSVDEVMAIRDQARALEACARIAKNKSLEADAVVLRMRAVRRLGQLQQAQKNTIGLNRGAAGGGKKTGPRGSLVNPRDTRPTLASQGVHKHLAQQARSLGALSDEKFEEVAADARNKVERAVRNAVREVEIEQEREAYRARTYEGCTVEDLESLVGKIKFGVICPDFPWEYETWSHKGKQRSAERHYETWPDGRILEFARIIKALAADDAALLMWTVAPKHPSVNERIIEACGFTYKTYGFSWVKTEPTAECIGLDGSGLHTGMGLAGTRSNIEVCLLATRGSLCRLSKGVDQIVIAPVGAHSEKPGEVYKRIERLYPGPRLELFARRPREGWWTWGDEIPRGSMATLDPQGAQAPSPDDDDNALNDIPNFLLRGSAS